MEGLVRTYDFEPGELTQAAVQALRAIDALGHEPILLGYHPVARMNPYHALLYQRVWSSGIVALPVVREERIPELTALAATGVPTVLHLHWLNQVMADAGSAKEAQRRRRDFLARLDTFRDGGGRIVWTVHNILPHGARFEGEEAHLSADVVERADVIHVLAEHTASYVEPWFRIDPAKVLHVPHPAYTGAYEDTVSREQARHELGIWPDELVHVVAGAIRPYKGLTDLLDAWDVVARDGVPRRLLIAGAPSEEPGVDALLERAAIHPSVLLHARSVPANEMQLFLRAADVAVLPYVRSLNSGALMLALTFGLPVVVPEGGGLAEVVDEQTSVTFRPGDTASLETALRASAGLVGPGARDAALGIAARHAPAVLAERFAAGLRERLAAASPSPRPGPKRERRRAAAGSTAR
jgi:glycosyltransferase involved in cell wall biosynthesis